MSLLQIIGGSLSARKLTFYNSNKFETLLRQGRVPTYALDELHINPHGGHLDAFSFVSPHDHHLGHDEVQMAQLIVFHNLKRLRTLKVNYALFQTPLELSDPISGLKQLVDSARKEQMVLPNLESLSLTMSRLPYSEFCQLRNGSGYQRRLVAPQLREIELCPGSSNWHNEQGFVPFLSVLIGEQLWKLRRIKIRYLQLHDPQANQIGFLEACIGGMLKQYAAVNRKIEFVLETVSGVREFTAEGESDEVQSSFRKFKRVKIC